MVPLRKLTSEKKHIKIVKIPKFIRKFQKTDLTQWNSPNFYRKKVNIHFPKNMIGIFARIQNQPKLCKCTLPESKRAYLRFPKVSKFLDFLHWLTSWAGMVQCRIYCRYQIRALCKITSSFCFLLWYSVGSLNEGNLNSPNYVNIQEYNQNKRSFNYLVVGVVGFLVDVTEYIILT